MKNETKTLTCRLSLSHYERFVDSANDEGASVAEHLRQLISDSFTKQEEQDRFAKLESAVAATEARLLSAIDALVEEAE